MNPRTVVVTVVLAACLSACGREREAGATQPVTPADGAIHLSPDQVRASDIRSADVVERTVAPSIAVIGRVKARAGGEAEVLSPFPGRLVGESLPRIGDTVTRGQRIADVEQQFTAADALQISAAAIGLQTSVEQAQQDLQLKRTELGRAQQLYEGGAIALKQLQTAEVDVKQAEARMEGARRAREQYDAAVSTSNSGSRRAPIAAPVSGTIIAADATLGQQVDPSKHLFTIADLRTVWVEAAVPERDLAPIRAARGAEIAVPGAPGSLAGALVTIGQLVDPQNRTVAAIFTVDNRAGALKIEMFVEVRVPTGPPSTVVMVPASAVLSEAGAAFVYVEAQPGVYARKVVALGDRRDDAIVVTSGLGRGDKVVTVGAGALRSEALKAQIPVEEDEKDKKREKD